jgi:hypothetical protein
VTFATAVILYVIPSSNPCDGILNSETQIFTGMNCRPSCEVEAFHSVLAIKVPGPYHYSFIVSISLSVSLCFFIMKSLSYFTIWLFYLFWPPIMKWGSLCHHSEALFVFSDWRMAADFENGFSSRLRFEWVWTRVESTLASMHSCVHSISFSTARDPFLNLLQPSLTFHSLQICWIRAISPSALRESFLNLLQLVPTLFDVLRLLNSPDSRELRNSSGPFYESNHD